jgi:hypothetical protein
LDLNTGTLKRGSRERGLSDQPKGILADRREAGGEATVKSGVEGVGAGAGAEAGAKTEQKIQTEGGEGMSVANMMAEDAQDHTRGKDDVTQGPDHEVVKGSEMTTMLPRRKNTTEIEAARPVGVKSIDEAMINTIDKSGEDEASAFYSYHDKVYNSPCEMPLLLRSGMTIMFTTKLVHPVKCCVRCPSPVSGLYCSHAKPVFSHSRKTFSTTLVLSLV